MPRKVAGSRQGISEADLEFIRPQLEVAYEVIRTWPIGKPAIDLAALVVLKVISVTSGQLKELGVYDDIRRVPVEASGPDDGGFF